MDLSKLSTADLQALQGGDLSKVSTEGLRMLQGGAQGAGREQRIAAQRETDRRLYDPTNDMGTVARAAAGLGSGMTSVLRAVGGGKLAEWLGLPATQEEAAQLDAPLADTTAGAVGQFVGKAAPYAAGAVLLPATLPGLVLGNAAIGAATTEGGAEERGVSAGLNALAGGVGYVAPNVYRAGKGLVSGLVAPFTKGGVENIAGRTIQRFATKPASPLAELAEGATVTGARPTLAEATADPGLATLERAIAGLDPQAASALAARQQSNNAARLNALQTIAGGEAEKAAALAARGTAARAGYQKAFDAGITPEAAASMAPQIESLMARPSIRRAMGQARRFAAEEGIDIAQPAGSVQGLHYLKQAIDARIEQLAKMGASNELRLTTQTADDLGRTLEELSPLYQTARRGYATDSVPINRQEVAQRLLDRTTSAQRDFAGNQRLQSNAFSRALNDEEQLLRQATGQRAYGSLDDLMTPGQSQTLNAVRSELETIANLSQAANGPGSQTAKALASQNLVRNIAGPLGLPEGFATSTIAQTLLRPAQFGYQMAEPRIQEAIARGLLNPQEANRLRQLAALADQSPSPETMALARQASTGLARLALGQP